VLDVGYKTLPLSIELSDIRLSTILRLEFYSLIDSFPCFEAITISCMHKPFIDFTFEIGSLNVMNLGAAEYNVASMSSLSLPLLTPSVICSRWSQ
jgi:Ca2+-dependent lipid-binding protein